MATLRELGSGIVGLVGAGPDGTKAALAVAISEDIRDQGASAAEIAAPAAKEVGGGTARNADVVAGGGPKVDGITAALERLREQAAA